MNNNSKLCKFISENPLDFETRLNELKINVNYEDNLAIFNYDIMADFSNPLVQEARGIIIDLDNLEVVCFPFNKFNNYCNENADTIDWNSAKVQEKLDGSIIKLFHYKDKWRWATNSRITPASMFTRLIKRCKKPSINWLDTLNKDNTYIFELVSPENQVVIKYNETKLIHLGTRNNITGKEEDIDIGFEKPLSYDLRSLDDCLDYVTTLNKNDTRLEHEGFVVVDKDYHRIKIKSPEYLVWHRLVSNHQMTKEDYLSLIVFSPDKLDDFCDTYKEYVPIIEYYKEEWNEFITDVDEFLSEVRSRYNGNRKEIAAFIVNSKYKDYGFRALNNDKTALDLVMDYKAYYDSVNGGYSNIFYYIDDYDDNYCIDKE